MRVIYTSNHPKEASTFSNFLKSKGIENQLEITNNQNWENPEYGVSTCHLWVIDEDFLDEALKWAEEFKKNPYDPQFKTVENPLKQILEPINKTVKESKSTYVEERLENQIKPKTEPLTLYTLITCIILFLFAAMTTPELSKLPESIPYSPIFSAPVNKTLMYDYPKAFEMIDQLFSHYRLEDKQGTLVFPKEANQLVNKFQNTPYWQGLYDKIVFHLQNPDSKWNFNAPMFEKIQEGQYWRLFTPALMHGSFLHILFNMILFVILGNQMEKKIGSFKLLIFILLTGIFSNTAQYLMTGTGFLGMSGVICAMIGFIFMRQKHAAWEGYQFSSVSLPSVLIFVMLMLGLQIISFFVEVYSKTVISPGIANTAHLSGLFIGALLGLTNLFKLKN